MKRSKRNTIIISLVLILLGVILICAGASMIGFDFAKLNSVTFEKNTHRVSEDYENIDISDLECDIIFKYRQNPNDITLVETSESDGIVNTVEVVDGTLKIRRVDNRKWYERLSVWWSFDSTMVVYLPKEDYNSLKLSTLSGDIEVSDVFGFADAEIKTVSGDIEYSASTDNLLNIKSTSGDIKCFAGANEVRLKTTSGDIHTSSYASFIFSAESTSGNISAGPFYGEYSTLKTTSGDITFSLYGIENGIIEIKTTSGNVTGTAHCELNYITDTTSGDIYVPKSVEGAPECIVETTSGDIKIDLEDDYKP